MICWYYTKHILSVHNYFFQSERERMNARAKVQCVCRCSFDMPHHITFSRSTETFVENQDHWIKRCDLIWLNSFLIRKIENWMKFLSNAHCTDNSINIQMKTRTHIMHAYTQYKHQKLTIRFYYNDISFTIEQKRFEYLHFLCVLVSLFFSSEIEHAKIS